MGDTLTVKPEILETLDLETTIQYTLQKNNVTDAVIAALKDKYGGLKLTSLQDKEGFLEIKGAQREVRKVGIIVEKLCKTGREDAIRIQKLWLSKEKEVLAKIGEVQNPLDAEIKRYEDEQERIAQEEIKRKDEAYALRQTTLLKMEAKYENGCFVLGNVSYETENIKEADEEIWLETILPKYKKEFDKVEEVRAYEERKKEEAAKELRVAQEKLEQEQAIFRKQQEEFKLQQEALQKQQSEAERIKNEEQQRLYQEAKDKKDAIINNRIQQLINLGLTYSPQYSAYVGYRCNIDVMTELKLWNEQEWSNAIEKITPVIEQVKKEAEEKRIEEIQSKERERITEENRQAELKKKQEEETRLAELALSGDKTKWEEIIKFLSKFPELEMRSGQYRRKLQIAKEKIEEIQAL